MDPTDDRQSPPLPNHPQHGVMLVPPLQQTQTFGFGHHFPNSNVFMMNDSASVPNSGNPDLISNPNFSFAPLTEVSHPFDAGFVPHQHQTQHQKPQPQQLIEPSALGASDAVTGTVTDTVGSEQTKKRRGRPRKYSTTSEGITIGLASNSQHITKAGGTDCENEVPEGNAADGSKEKKQRGRPPGSGKKQSSAVAGGAGVAFHLVIVPEGENIVSKLVELCQGPRTIFVSGASGSVRNVTLRQLAGGSLYHEGQFDIAVLSGSSCFVNSDGNPNNTLNLTVILARPDGKLFVGGVTRELIAASCIQMVAGSFVADTKQSNKFPISASHMLNFGCSSQPNNSTQHDGGSKLPSDDECNVDGHTQNQNPGFYNFGQPCNSGTAGWA